MLLNLFRKNKKEIISAPEVVTDGYYTVIGSDDILEEPKPAFGVSKRLTEEEYTELLKSKQALIKEYEANQISGNKEGNDMLEKNKELISFFNYDKISVTKDISGKYKVCTNGHHRMYVAKTNGLKLIVYVVQEELL